ncbi:hypothetical protein MNV_30026 [Candidatus Methanoperedens nitroreducens]|uniref:Uncharacterized protein n=1 Tax=Candidatus Methanoperedens nitratireducens TaxID=1392998 RepID=A0A284VQ17_9EURY|nr:hypothetical protein MNV_30026 [Candidatus Methanoperedens nitroreducens]
MFAEIKFERKKWRFNRHYILFLYFIYVPDNSAKSKGVWRLTFNSAAKTVGSPFLLAPTAGLGGTDQQLQRLILAATST